MRDSFEAGEGTFEPSSGSELKERLHALEESVRRLTEQQQWTETLLVTIPATVIRASVDGVIEYVNHVSPRYTGPPPVGQTIFEITHEQENAEIRRAVDTAVLDREISSFELRTDVPGLGTTDFLFAVGPLFSDGAVSGIVLVGTDISERKQVEADLLDHKQRLDVALDAAKMGIWRWDRRSDRVEWDERTRLMFDVPEDRVPKTVAAFMSLVPLEQKDFVAKRIAASLATGEPMDYELGVSTRSGMRWLHIRGGVARQGDGQIIGLVGAVLDTTERRIMEETLRHQQKMVAAGQLSAGVAHNFNNMLAVVLPALELAREEAAPQIARLLDDAIDAASNAAQLVRDLMTFSKNEARNTRKEPLSEAMRRAIELCQRTFDRRIEIRVDGLDQARQCAVDSATMEQAFMNLLINARDALETSEGNQQFISVKIQTLRAEESQTRYPHGPSPCVEIRVSDNGQGMSDEVKQRIMEPFFTTKVPGRGTGLGLSTAWATVRGHGGILECETASGQGTTFILVLPTNESDAALEGPSSVSQSRQALGSVVLIIDDEAGVRRAMTHILEAAGYAVHQAESGIAGLEIADRIQVNLVLMDYSMPGMSPENVLNELRVRLPGIPVVSVSGLGSTLTGADAYLTKPVERDTLLDTLGRLIAPGHQERSVSGVQSADQRPT